MRCPSRDSNPAPPEYNSRALSLVQTARCFFWQNFSVLFCSTLPAPSSLPFFNTLFPLFMCGFIFLVLQYVAFFLFFQVPSSHYFCYTYVIVKYSTAECYNALCPSAAIFGELGLKFGNQQKFKYGLGGNEFRNLTRASQVNHWKYAGACAKQYGESDKWIVSFSPKTRRQKTPIRVQRNVDIMQSPTTATFMY
jgi:hypothetical protein